MRKSRIAGVAASVVALSLVARACATQLLPLPDPTVTLTAANHLTIPGTPPIIPPPAQGSFAVETTQDGELASHNGDVPRPMASMAKTMTALAVLTVHPLIAGDDGPNLTVTAADVATLNQIIAEGGSYAPVVQGEILTERQMLLGLMLPSANNFAVMLAHWIDGSQAAFVARLNSMGASLGMVHTAFTDPDGLSDQTVASPNDLLKLGAAAIANPALKSITSTANATLPDGSVISNLDSPVATVPGWLGIKTGHTPAAGYCLLFAAQASPAGSTDLVTVVGVVMGQGTRDDTFTVAENAVTATVGGYSALDIATLHPAVTGQVTAAWGTTAGYTTTAQSRHIVLRMGASMPLVLHTQGGASFGAAGASVGTVTSSVGGQPVTWTVSTISPIGPPSRWWRLLNVR